MNLTAFAIALVVSVSTLSAADAGQGSHDYHNDYTKHAQFYKAVTPQQYVTLPDDTTVAMTCSKCKTVMITTKRDLATKPGRGTVTEAIATDTCPGCGEKMVLKRGGKETGWVHSCKSCGDHRVDCCAPVDSIKAAR